MTAPESVVTGRDAVRLLVLGSTDLSHDGAPISAVLTQPKRLGLLAPGLFVSGAPDFERWLSAERRELREAVREPAAAMAESAEATSHMVRARGAVAAPAPG